MICLHIALNAKLIYAFRTTVYLIQSLLIQQLHFLLFCFLLIGHFQGTSFPVLMVFIRFHSMIIATFFLFFSFFYAAMMLPMNFIIAYPNQKH